MNKERRISSNTLTLGQPLTIQLPKEGAIRNITLKLKGSVTISGGTTNGAPKDSSTARLITQITVRHPQYGAIFQLPMHIIHRLNHIYSGARPQMTEIASGAVQSNTPVEAVAEINFENLIGIKPFDTLLKAQGLNSLDLVVEVASSLADFVQGGDRAIAVGTTAFTLDTMAEIEELSNMADLAFSQIRQSILFNSTVSGASNQFQIKPIPTGMMYKAIILYAEDAGQPTNALIDHIILKSGSEQFRDVNAESLQRRNKHRFGLETMPSGYYVLDFMSDGRLNACLDTRKGTGRDEMEASLVTNAPSGTATIRTIGLQYYPLDLLGGVAAAAGKAA